MELEKHKVKVTGVGIIPTHPIGSTQHANNGSYFKIYVIKHSQQIHYVGLAKQKMRDRFGGSFRAYSQKKQNGVSAYSGYSGYKWIAHFEGTDTELDLFVFAFPDKTKSKEDRVFMEAIEAEIVFLIRSNPPFEWPVSQHEIHFHNIAGANKIAKEIYEQIKG